MKPISAALLLITSTVLLTGCTHNDTPAPSSPQQAAQTQQQFQQTLSSPNLPPALKQVIQEQMKQHGAPQRPPAAPGAPAH